VNAAHQREIIVGKNQRHQLVFFHADAVLAGERAANFDAIANDFVGGGDGAFEVRRIARIVEDDGMEVAVTGMKNVADLKTVGFGNFGDAAESLRELGARDHAVENVIAGSEASEGAEGVFAALPEKFALASVACDAHFARVMREAHFVDGGGLRGDGFGETFELDEQNSGAVARESSVHVVFNGVESPAIDHFAGGGSDGAGGDFGDGARGVVEIVENGEQSFYGFGLARKFHGDFGDEGQRALGTDEQAAKIVTGRIAVSAADAYDFSIGEDEFERDNVIGGDAVRKRVRAASVFGNVAADGAGFLAGRIRSVIEAVVFDGASDIEIDDAGLHGGALIFEVDSENFVHVRKCEHDAAGTSERAAGKAGAGAASHDGKIVASGEFDEFGNFGCGFGKDDQIGAAFVDGAVVFVEEQIFGAREDAGGGG